MPNFPRKVISKDGLLLVLGYTTSLPIYHDMEATLQFLTAYANRHVKEIIQPSLRSRRVPSHSRNTPLLQRCQYPPISTANVSKKAKKRLHTSREILTRTTTFAEKPSYHCRARTKMDISSPLQRILNPLQRQQGSRTTFPCVSISHPPRSAEMSISARP